MNPVTKQSMVFRHVKRLARDFQSENCCFVQVRRYSLLVSKEWIALLFGSKVSACASRDVNRLFGWKMTSKQINYNRPLEAFLHHTSTSYLNHLQAMWLHLFLISTLVSSYQHFSRLRLLLWRHSLQPLHPTGHPTKRHLSGSSHLTATSTPWSTHLTP